MIDITQISAEPPEKFSKDKVKKKFKKLVERIGELAALMYAQRKYSLLVVFQGMDASGKDGSTRVVFQDCPPYLVSTKSFKKPTDEEYAHDFLWRAHKATPEKGTIKVFNRSHYEDVLIQRVHKWVDEDRVAVRMKAINAFEELLEKDNDTIVLKFCLHLTPDRQLEKLQERIDVPEKNWKHNDGDWEEREHWAAYMRCYNDVINTCNAVPWHIIPANAQWYRNYCIAKVIVETLEQLDMEYPALDSEKFKAKH